jgi:hypothetical protein
MKGVLFRNVEKGGDWPAICIRIEAPTRSHHTDEKIMVCEREKEIERRSREEF